MRSAEFKYGSEHRRKKFRIHIVGDDPGALVRRAWYVRPLIVIGRLSMTISSLFECALIVLGVR